MDCTRLVSDLIAITSRLIVLMTAEIDFLRAADVKKAEALQGEKASLARAYETLIRELKKHPETMRSVAPVLRDELVAKARDFQRLLLRNEAVLRAAKETNQRVLKAVADAVTDGRKGHSPYARTGKPPAPTAAEPPLSLRIDETF